MKILTVVGARPQFVKAAVVSRQLKLHNVEEILLHTGQHFDSNMSDIFFEEMGIPAPQYNLAISGLSHGAMTGQMIEEIEKVLIYEKPDWVLVYGDTNSTLAGAIAAKKLNIKLAHVEAGLRSFNNLMPEEINRILTDRISDLLFCANTAAIDNLNEEGFKKIKSSVYLVGDVMLDAAIYYSQFLKKPNFEIPNKFVVCTVHRAENTDDENKLKRIFAALEEISKYSKVIIPLHPRTKTKLNNMNFDFEQSSIIFVEPLGYFEMVYLYNNCELVITDSGGMQKEAFFFKRNCITIREETEWVELVENGFNVLTGSNYDKILNAYFEMSHKKNDFSMNLYGTGNTSEIIVKQILNYKN